ncbi:hypothetical protein AN189_05590 [Loktanella sp. 3ANDIMAR09]|uniref:hypothetical protein n=1 Tax=Loktanella sp. 3ANDIMAR09 TaxID=1225657 RepID=UPI0006FE6EE9|nr:hypothetical protein [Loktanella sp. 3ANDIMAR09]KQI69061.1 hypothetical protein AN189_05590 [Loktanella sp. 3ANDIMAR09]
MTDRIADFFAAWGETDAAKRRATIAACMADHFVYCDPRSPGQITTLDGLAEYIGMYSQMAPGWTAGVIQTDAQNGFARSIVGFGDGGDWAQHGTYFAALNATGQMTTLAGFVGAGGLPQ